MECGENDGSTGGALKCGKPDTGNMTQALSQCQTVTDAMSRQHSITEHSLTPSRHLTTPRLICCVAMTVVEVLECCVSIYPIACFFVHCCAVSLYFLGCCCAISPMSASNGVSR